MPHQYVIKVWLIETANFPAKLVSHTLSA